MTKTHERPTLRIVNDGRPWWQKKPCPRWCEGHKDPELDPGHHGSDPLFHRREQADSWRPGFRVMLDIESIERGPLTHRAEITIATLVMKTPAQMTVIRMTPDQAEAMGRDLLRLAAAATG